jgi:putative ABC transport system permease protein
MGLAALFGQLNKDNPTLGYFMPWPVPMFTAIAVFSICLIAGLISVRRVLVLEPAVVFRM